MSSTQFVEAFSEDSFVRDLHRRAVRLLNDPTLDRKQREFHIKRLQSQLVAHQAKEAAKNRKLVEKGIPRDQVSRTDGKHRVADPSQVVARRSEFSQATPLEDVHESEITVQRLSAANDSDVKERNRSVLTLKRA